MLESEQRWREQKITMQGQSQINWIVPLSQLCITLQRLRNLSPLFRLCKYYSQQFIGVWWKTNWRASGYHCSIWWRDCISWILLWKILNIISGLGLRSVVVHCFCCRTYCRRESGNCNLRHYFCIYRQFDFLSNLS